MDKQTLSNYGWIVILVLILVILIALASPFGIFVSDAVKSTTQGLFDVNSTALNAVGIDIPEASLTSSSASETTYYTVEEIEADEHLYAIGKTKPEYVVAKFNDDYSEVVITKNGDDSDGITIEFAPWTSKSPMVQHSDTLKTAIIKEGITQMNSSGGQSAFSGCKELTFVTLPKSLTYLGSSTFRGCTSLKTAPVMPDGITSMDSTFDGCTSLTAAPTIPNSVTSMSYTFSGCTSLKTAPIIPNGVTNMFGTFSGCTSLTTAPVIPNSVTDMQATFLGCISLTVAPVIPNSKVDLGSTFENCTSLTTISTIPNNVTNVYCTFSNCTSLTGTIEINTNASEHTMCFNNIDYQAQKITLTGTSSILDEIGKTGTNYCTTCNGYCKGSH